MRNWKIIGLLLALALVISGCGRKEAPTLSEDGGKPSLTDLNAQIVSGTLTLTFVLHGDPEGVGYQIDRTRMDPYCQCPGFWRRYFEQPARANQVDNEIEKLIKLKDATTDWVFRIRAIDQYGNFGPWSRAIHARGIDLTK